MSFPEFLEFIGRLAEIKFKHSGEMANNTLAWKIECILEELCPVFRTHQKRGQCRRIRILRKRR